MHVFDFSPCVYFVFSQMQFFSNCFVGSGDYVHKHLAGFIYILHIDFISVLFHQVIFEVDCILCYVSIQVVCFTVLVGCNTALNDHKDQQRVTCVICKYFIHYFPIDNVGKFIYVKYKHNWGASSLIVRTMETADRFLIELVSD